ncbi:MAG TPA: SDR family oxidoreductase [Myxococcaceae bacterium]|nr:SDR family oxidoreductase [Myxococcaceae bacterium]
MRVTVTGANGLVGSRLCRLLVVQGHAVTAVARGQRRTVGDYAYLSCDLSDHEGTARALSTSRPDVVVHTASMTEVDACERDPDAAWAANVVATAHVARHARAAGAHLIYVSTDYVFDGLDGPYDEEARPNPSGVYARTKWLGEEAVRLLAGTWAIARTAVVYGFPPSQRPNFGSWLLESLQAGKTARLFVDQFVSPSLALNVAEMLAELAERRLPGIWNVAGAEVVNRMQFGEALADVFGLDRHLLVPIELADAAMASPRPPRSGLRVDRALATLRARPLGLQASLEQFRAEVEAGA